jgi:hypothetical protein
MIVSSIERIRIMSTLPSFSLDRTMPFIVALGMTVLPGIARYSVVFIPVGLGSVDGRG